MTITRTRRPILTGRALSVAWTRHATSQVVGRRLAWSREAAGVTQRELAAYVGVSRRTIQRVELGERSMSPVECAAIASALGCSIATFTAASSDGKAMAA